MLEITDKIQIDEADLEFQAVQAGGPGGQNVNKVATMIVLRYKLERLDLPEDARLRLALLAGQRINQAGELVIRAGRHRTQEQNRTDAVHRLVDLLRQALQPPRPRHPTRPTRASQQRRLEQKRRRSIAKDRRRERFDGE
jgi:ribosome-associated protein